MGLSPAERVQTCSSRSSWPTGVCDLVSPKARNYNMLWSRSDKGSTKLLKPSLADPPVILGQSTPSLATNWERSPGITRRLYAVRSGINRR
jgi:hypothetical protein